MASEFEYVYGGTLLKLQDISLAFGNFLVLRNISEEVMDIKRPNMQQGQIIGLLGPSGVGKTQLCRIICGLQKSTTGLVTINVNEQDVPVRRGLVGMVSQRYPLFRHRTMIGNLKRAGKKLGLSNKDAEEKGMALLGRFGLADKAKCYRGQLSGGQQQRVAIAQQMMCSEHFILLDEPFSGLDTNAKNEVCELITEVSRIDERNTLVIITHDTSAAISISDHLWIMGLDRREDGTFEPGAYIKHKFDLIERGLAWKPNVALTAEFANCYREIRELFKDLSPTNGKHELTFG